MSELERLAGDTNDAGQPQEGNRPAQNARLTTPGWLSTQGYQGGDEAGDFLGLDAEVGGGGGPFELMAQPEPEPSAWVETPAQAERGHDAAHDDVEYAESEEPAPVESEEDDADLHGSWSESQPKRNGHGKLIGAAAGVLVLGMLGVAAMKFMDAAAEPTATGEPMAARPAPRVDRNAALVAPVAVDEPSARAQAGLAGAVGSGAPEVSGSVTGSDPRNTEDARAAFEAQRGDEPPAWFDPTLDSQAQPPETGWSEEAEAVTRASIFIGDPMLLVATLEDGEAPTAEAGAETVAETVAEADDGPDAADSSAVVAMAQGDEAVVGETVESQPAAPTGAAVAVAGEGAQADAPPAATELVASADTSAAAVDVPPAALASESAPATHVVSAAAPPVAGPLDPKPLEPVGVGPTAPAGAASSLPSEGILAGYPTGRASRTSTLKVEDVLLAPTMDSSNLRQADAKDLKGVWTETSVPMQALGNKTKVLTPNVGRVRVVLTSKDIFEGTLYAVGQGSVWLESEYGRISVDGKRIASVANIDTKEGTPTLGSTGSQNMTGLEKVRVKTPGGSFYGKVIARDETHTTLITEDGAKLTLANTDVELLTDVPKVTIGGKVGDAPAKKP